jgi:hypothetical protein
LRNHNAQRHARDQPGQRVEVDFDSGGQMQRHGGDNQDRGDHNRAECHAAAGHHEGRDDQHRIENEAGGVSGDHARDLHRLDRKQQHQEHDGQRRQQRIAQSLPKARQFFPLDSP